MAELHTLIVYDTDTKSIRFGAPQEMPVDSDEWVYEDPDWRHPTEEEVDTILEVEAQIHAAMKAAGLNV